MMAGGGRGAGRLYGGHGGSSMTALIQNQRTPSSSHPLDTYFISGSSPSFLGSGSMVSFEDLYSGKRSERPFVCTFDGDENGDDDFDEYFHQPEKKRRLTTEQVQLLEKNFEEENKLEPERKIQLAKDLGLQPRQVAIWFQNRRARWKTKQLEKEFDTLQANFDSLKSEYDILLKEKDKLKAEVIYLTDKLHVKEKEQGDQETSDTEIQMPTSVSQDAVVDSTSEDEAPQQISASVCKQEDRSSATIDVLDSDSPRHVDGSNSSSAFIEPIGSSYALEPDKSDLSQDEEDNLNQNLFPSSAYVLPKMEDVDDYSDEPLANSCYSAFLVGDQGSWFWS